jgi:hypothetical protein
MKAEGKKKQLTLNGLKDVVSQKTELFVAIDVKS